MSDTMNTEQRLEDHEQRIRKLEDATTRQEMQLMNLEKGQLEIKNLTLQQNGKLSDFTQDLTKMLTSNLVENSTDNTKTNNKIKLLDRKELWAIVGTILGIIVSIITLL